MPDDDDAIAEGRRRLRGSGLTDEQISAWIERVRRWGGRIELTTVGLTAFYDRPGST